MKLLKPPRKSLISNQIGVQTAKIVVGPLYLAVAFNFEAMKITIKLRDLNTGSSWLASCCREAKENRILEISDQQSVTKFFSSLIATINSVNHCKLLILYQKCTTFLYG